MSRKRRRRPNSVSKPVEPVAVTDETAQDGYVNSLAYLGEASPLSQANDYERHSISNDFNLLTILYRENWLAARIIDTPCEDMTRSWYSVSSELEQDKLDELQKLEAKHSVKQEITNAIRWGRLYGGAAAVMVIKGQEDMLDEPLDYDMLQPGCFRGLIVIDRVRGIFPSLELEEDMDDPEFGYPKWYQVTLNEESGEIIRIHHSRLLLFRGRQLPIDEEVEADYWGASELEHVYEELQKRNSSSANIAQLIFQANVAAIKISDYGEVLGMGTAAQRKQVYNYIQEMNRLRTSFGVTLMGNEDNYEQHPYSFAGVAEVYETFMMDMAGASEIPATKLFGRAPQGMNATGESDMKNYYEVVNQLQERILRPALEKLLPVMCMSLWGVIPEDLEIVFEPLGTTTPSERAEIMGQAANPIIQAFSAGLISQKTALMELKESGKPINAWSNISDEDIENAEDQVDQGEGMQDPMGMMGPGGGGMPPEGPGGPGGPGMPPGGEMPPEMAGEMPAEGEQPEVDTDKVHELKERVRGIREKQDLTDRIEKAKARIHSIRETQGEHEDQARLEKIHELKERVARLTGENVEDGGPGSGPPPGYKKKGLIGRLFNRGNVAPQATKQTPVQNVARKATKQTEVQNVARKATPKKPGIIQRAKGFFGGLAGKKAENRPQTAQKASVGERLKFLTSMANGTAVQPSKPREKTSAEVKKANREREDWYNLTTHQKIAGASEQNSHMRQIRSEIAKLAAKGDVKGAKKLLEANRQYFSNDPESAMKVQSETLKRQKAARQGVFHDEMEEDGGPGSGNHRHAGRPGKRGGSAPRGASQTGGPDETGGPEGPVSRNDELREKAVKKYGYTDNINRAGYLLPNGKMLDFKRSGGFGGIDHRDVESLYEDKKGSEAMFDFMSGGNVRIISEAPGFSVVKGVPLTREQYDLIEEFADGTDSNKFYVDVFDKNGKLESSKIYRSFESDPVGSIMRDLRKNCGVAKKEAIQSGNGTEENAITPSGPVDNGPQEAYNGKATKGWAKLGAEMKVAGPKGARKFIKDYFERNPEVAKEVPKYMGVRKQVADFLKDHPEAQNFNTYDAKTGEVKPISKGFCVTFHQNNTPDDPLGGYSDEDYAGLCAIAVHELGAPGVNIGYYGNPEVSFECQSEEVAKRFAVEHNQQSIYNASTGRTLKNKQYRPEHNPIRL